MIDQFPEAGGGGWGPLRVQRGKKGLKSQIDTEAALLLSQQPNPLTGTITEHSQIKTRTSPITEQIKAKERS